MTFPSRPSPSGTPVAHAQRAREQPHVRDLLARRAALDLEHGARDAARPASPRGRRQQLGDRRRSAVHARAGDGRAEEHRVHERPPGLRGERRAQPGRRARPPPSTYAASSASSCSASTLEQPGRRRRGTGEGRRPGARARGPCPSAPRPGVSVRRARAARGRSCAPRRSILLTKISVGMRSRRRARIRTRVCACTPSTADTTSTAPSSTPSTRSTSAMKSGWPGVSIRLTVTSPTANDTTADLIVMPRRRSSARVSVRVLPASTLPSSSMTPAAYSSRSVRLVLPASTWATIPRLSSCHAGVMSSKVDGRVGHQRLAHAELLGGTTGRNVR